jgi:DNA-binding MarR family transcriptional regulator
MDKKIIDLIFQLKRMCALEEEDIGAQVGLTTSEVFCILAIEPQEEVSSNTLSRRMNLSPSRGSRVVDSLIARGHLERKADPDDRRYIRLSLTPSGKKCRLNVLKAKNKCEHKIEKKLDVEQRTLVVNGLKTLLNVL